MLRCWAITVAIAAVALATLFTAPPPPPSPLDRYTIVEKLGGGFFGDTWLATRGGAETFVIKRLMDDPFRRQSGYREDYFGRLFLNPPNTWVSRIEESFSWLGSFYLVSLYEGHSLDDVLYNKTSNWSKEPSVWWYWMKTTSQGRLTMKSIIFQLLKAADYIHTKGVTHRDIKPSNIALCSKALEGGSCNETDIFGNVKLRLLDFGSALDTFSITILYKPGGPSMGEQYFIRMPPECFLNHQWFLGSQTSKYDTWTIGVLIIELITGDHYAFPVTGGPLPSVEHRLHSFTVNCVEDIVGIQVTRKPCSEEKFQELIKRRDPLGIGFHDMSLLALVRGLINGDPNKRLDAASALQHRFFR